MPPEPESAPLINAIPELDGELSPALFPESSYSTLIMWCIVAAVALAAAGFIWWIRRNRRSEQPGPTPLETALAALQTLEDKLPPLRECSLQVSLIVRSYLQGQVQDTSLYETHEEFSQRPDALSSVPDECRYDTRYLLEKLADLKYAGNRELDPVQTRTLIEQARALVNRIDEARRQQAAETAATQPPTA